MFRIADDSCSPGGNHAVDKTDHVDAGHSEITIDAP
jgi:hypothetical protein